VSLSLRYSVASVVMHTTVQVSWERERERGRGGREGEDHLTFHASEWEGGGGNTKDGPWKTSASEMKRGEDLVNKWKREDITEEMNARREKKKT